MTIKAAVWLRVSTDHQEASNQIPDIERFLAHHGFEETRRYVISESAWNVKSNGEYRRNLDQALADAWSGHFEVLVVWALDRITREGAEAVLRLKRMFAERGCTLMSTKETWISGTSGIEEPMIALKGWSDQQESARRGDRIRAAMAERKAKGLPVGGRKLGSKDNVPRRTEGYEAAWKPGGPQRLANVEPRTYTCQLAECGIEFTSANRAGTTRFCSPRTRSASSARTGRPSAARRTWQRHARHCGSSAGTPPPNGSGSRRPGLSTRTRLGPRSRPRSGSPGSRLRAGSGCC